jgi:hypothetical protein
MPTEIPDLWGDDIDVDVVSPHVILKTQAEAIARRTKGLLTAEVSTSAEPDDDFNFTSTHKLLILARSIGYEGEELLQIQHPDKRYYPLSIEVPSGIVWDYSDSDTPTCYRRCNDQDELIAALRTVLTSPPTKATLNNLLARVNEKREQQK